MKKLNFIMTWVVIVALLPGCAIIGDIFKAGVWVGILLVVGIIGLIFWLIGKSKK